MLSHVQISATPCSTPGSSIRHYFPEFAQIHIHWVGGAIYRILCRSLLLLPSIFPSIKVFPNELALHIRRPNYWSFSLIISHSNEYLGLMPFRIDWFNLLAVQGTLKSVLQHHNLKASIFCCSAFFTIQLTSLHGRWKNYSFDHAVTHT